MSEVKNIYAFALIFPKYKDFHFFKDPGQIAFRLSKLGYKVSIICYRNECAYLNSEKYVQVNTIPSNRIFRKFNLGIIVYLVFNSCKIDVLNLFHLKWESLLFAFIYKLFNPRGFVYLKMDNCHYSGIYPWEKIFDQNKEPTSIYSSPDTRLENLKNFLIKKSFIQRVDLWSVEDDESKIYYEKQYSFFKDKLITIYNGHAIDLAEKITIKSFSEKENIILSVGRFGTFQKATEILLQSFNLITEKCNWNLHLAGSVEEKFKEFIHFYFINNPNLKGRVIIHGPLDKKSLYELYNNSKIFCLPSRFECFAIVYSEAMFYGNVIITTPYTSLKDMIVNEKLGLLVEIDNINSLADAMLKLIENQELSEKYSLNAQSFVKKNLNWNEIVTKIDIEINKRIK